MLRLAVLLVLGFYIYVRRNFFKQGEKIEYTPIGANEVIFFIIFQFEMSFGSSLRRNKNRDSEFNEDTLVDYEIKPLKEKKRFNSEL